MSESINEPTPSTAQGKVTCHLVAMPKIILTRIDEGNLPIPVYTRPLLKKPVKRLAEKKSKALLPKTVQKSKTSLPKSVRDKPSVIKHDTRGRGRPKKDYRNLSRLTISPQKVTNNKVVIEKPATAAKKAPKQIAKPENNTVKGMLKKTMLQKRSKIAIPPAKKPKSIPSKPVKSTPPPPKPKKRIPPKTKVSISPPPPKPAVTDSSEDEFLYDELIEELVNTPVKQVASVQPIVEKTTNITLKPNLGNKPPTIVKGGIIKKTNLPADLKSVASPTTLNSSKQTVNALKSRDKSPVIGKIMNTPVSLENPIPGSSKRASPWPVSISTPSKIPKETPNRNQKRVVDTPVLSSIISVPKGSSKQSKVQKPKSIAKPIVAAPKIASQKEKPKIGPKKAKKIHPLLAADEESDEYTEIETLENIDSEPIEILSKIVSDPVENNEGAIKTIHTVSDGLSNPTQSVKHPKDDEDPHLDLLRILTDDSDDITSVQPNEPKENVLHEKNNTNNHSDNDPKPSNSLTSGSSISRMSETSNGYTTDNSSDQVLDHSTSHTNEVLKPKTTKETSGGQIDVKEPSSETPVEDTPTTRTIYDLMNDISLQYPSWNLHIIPETNAFCIAQVTKGRLGLPTLKKCIELDPETYSAKVYIHQYHIKRFDGVYDSEETIVALIEEIHSIKA